MFVPILIVASWLAALLAPFAWMLVTGVMTLTGLGLGLGWALLVIYALCTVGAAVGSWL